MNSADYWQQRAEENALRIYRYADRKAQMVTRWFGRARREMQKKVDDFYRQYAREEQISLIDAKSALANRRALAMTLEEYHRLVAQSPLDSVLQKRLRKVSLARTVSREEFLLMQLELLQSELYREYASETTKSVTEIFEDSYYKGLFDQQQFIGYGSAFNRLSTHQIEAATTTAWKGANYSERLWGRQRVSLARYLNRIVTTGFIEGKSNAQMRVELQKSMDIGAYEARRLIRTECAQVASRASLLSYQENGTPQFEFLATLDYKTSIICRSMDGKVFVVADGRIGVNIPPLHPFCRSTTVPHIPDAEFDRDDTRAARNAEGVTYKVPADMKFREWHKKYVETVPAELLAETKSRHGTADAKQFARYRDLLGKDAPKSLDALQNLKYTGDGEQYRYLELDYRRRNRLRASPELVLPNAGIATATAEKFTRYLFCGDNPAGLAKGRAFTSRLGYGADNWEQLRSELLRKAPLYPAMLKSSDAFGQRYEQKMVLNGLLLAPANVIVGWCEKDGNVWLTSAYIKEVD